MTAKVVFCTKVLYANILLFACKLVIKYFNCGFWLLQASPEGIVRTAEEEDSYLEQRGPLRKFQNQIGCVQDIVRYRTNPAAIPSGSDVISGKNYHMDKVDINFFNHPF